MNYPDRLHTLQRRLRQKNIDALLVSEQHNRRYLSGYTATDHDIGESSGVLLVPASGDAYLLTDFRYRQQAEREATGFQVEIYERGLLNLLKPLLKKLGVSTLAFEAEATLHSTVLAMQKELAELHLSLEPTSGLIEKMRRIKDEEEIELIRRSVRLNEEVFLQVYEVIDDYGSEIEVALALEQAMRMGGAESPSFATIVASAENSALPHAVPGRGKIVQGRPLTIDMGLVLDGYCSDMTRTFVPGEQPDGRYLELHRLVRQAQLAGIAAIRAGVTAREVDSAARTVIADAGYGENFGHSLGHGVGLAVHEAPRLSSRVRKKLQAGMVVTVEPGIYIPGWGGIRLENMVVVREDGCELLNTDTTWLDP